MARKADTSGDGASAAGGSGVAALPGAKRRALARDVDHHTSVALLEFQSPTATLIAQPVPASARYTGTILTTLVLVTLVVLGVVKVDRVVTTTGQTVAAAPNIVVQPLETSIVRHILVHAGQSVHKDQLLAELDPTFAGGDAKSTSAQAASLAAEVARLRAELAGVPYLSDGTPYGTMQALLYAQRRQEFATHLASLQAKVDSLQVKVDQAQAAVDSAATRLVGLRDVEARRMELERLQVGSHLNTLAARDSRLQMEGQLVDAQKTRESGQKDLQGAIADVNNYVQQWKSDTSQSLTTQERLLSDMTAQSTKAQLRHELVELRAPQDAVVLSVAQVSIGSVLQSGDEFIRLVPADAPMEVTALVPGNTVGFVHLGDAVTVKFDTFPYFQYGFAIGRVEVISPDSFATPPPPANSSMPQVPNTQASAPSNMPTSSAVYVAKISINEMRMRNIVGDFRLTPGMPVSADIHVGTRSVLAALFARVAPLAAEGLRDP